MEKLKQIDKNSIDYDEYLYVIKKDLERIMIYISSLDDFKKSILLSKFEQLHKLVSNKIEYNSTNYENDKIIISDDYVMLNFFDNQELIEIDNNTDVSINKEFIILIKRNMKEFYFSNRKIIYEVSEGDFVSKKIQSIWNNERYIVENKSILCDEKIIDIDDLIEQKVYMKGSKK